MDAKLQELIDHHEIRKTLSEYCHGCDRADETRMASVYAKDSWDDHGQIKAPGPDFSAAMVQRIREVYDTMYHLLGQSTIKVTGDEASAETYFLGISRTKTDPPMCNQIGGRFVDRLVRAGGGWKIKRRTVVGDWNLATAILAEWEPARHLVSGRQSNDDPVYAALGRVHGSLTEAG